MPKAILFMAILLVFSTFGGETSIKSLIKSNIQEASGLEWRDPDALRPFSVICKVKGYPFESHKILTEDGYWLTAFRIPGGKGEIKEDAKVKSKPVIFLQHGVVDSADGFIMNDEARSPAFILANQGYDVWLGNSRGNKHSREHQYLHPDDPDDAKFYWNFDFEEMGHYDVKANVEYILKVTGKQKLAIAAHSQGTSQMMVAMADHNDWWNEKVSIFVCLAGVSRLDHSGSHLVQLLANQPIVVDTIRALGVEEMFPNKYLQNEVFSIVCSTIPSVCDLFLEIISDDDTTVNNQERMGVFMGHYPAGASLRWFDHFAQLIRAKKFQRYDFGEKINMAKYGQKTPPEIDLSKIHGTKIIQIVGNLDKLADPTDNKWLNEQLGKNVIYYQHYELGHMGFLLAKDMQFMKDVIDLLKQNPWD